jgi:hypothetical protein
MAVPQDLIFMGRALQRSAPWLGWAGNKSCGFAYTAARIALSVWLGRSAEEALASSGL